jgi:hypothetical protein
VRGRRPIAHARARRTHLVLLLPAIALLLERDDLAVERGDVVVALEERLLVRLVLRLGGLGALVRGVRVGAQQRESLRPVSRSRADTEGVWYLLDLLHDSARGGRLHGARWQRSGVALHVQRGRGGGRLCHAQSQPPVPLDLRHLAPRDRASCALPWTRSRR